MPLTNYAIEQMGYKLIDSANPIEASFFTVTVFAVRGLSSSPNDPLDPSALLTTHGDITFTIADSVNDACQKLMGNNFVANEAEWVKEKQVAGPYLVVKLADPNTYTASTGRWQEVEGVICTYDTFTQQRFDLRDLESQVVRELATSLSIAFSGLDRPVTMHFIQTVIAGRTPSNQQLEDGVFITSMDAHVSRALPAAELLAKMQSALAISSRLPANVGVFVDLAAYEKDKLKKFLYQFYALEIFTKATFQTLTAIPHNNYPGRLCRAVTEIDAGEKERKRHLKQNFIWCSIEKWQLINDSDFDLFKSMKDIRDDISHGVRVDEKNLPVEYLDQLLRKVLSYA